MAAGKSLLALSDFLNVRASGRNVVIAFAMLAVFYSATLPLLPVFFPDGSGLVPLDEPALFTAREVLAIVDGWGESGRRYQLWFHLSWDFVAPILNFLFLGFGISWLFQRAFGSGSRWRRRVTSATNGDQGWVAV